MRLSEQLVGLQRRSEGLRVILILDRLDAQISRKKPLRQVDCFQWPGMSSRFHYDELLSHPLQLDDDQGSFQRLGASYLPRGERFRVRQRTFERQFAQMYFARLMLLGPAVREAAQKKWPGTEVVKILNLVENKTVVVVGTAYKNMKLKPSVLDEYTKSRGVKQLLGGTSFTSDDDTMVLEDEGARMVLSGDGLHVHELVTGVIMAVKGHQDEESGTFVVEDVCFAGLPPQPPVQKLPEDKYVALVSGLSLGGHERDPLRVQLLVDFLTGSLGSRLQQEMSAKVVHVIIAGGSTGALEAVAAAPPHSRKQNSSIQHIKDLDMLTTELAAALPVDIMPGPDDPANVSLPQQPLHKCLFPGASRYLTFRRVTNPHECEVDRVRILGTSGQNIDDIYKYSRSHDRLQMLEQTLTWRHLAPTAPDTLATYPFSQDDPFILTEAPHVYFVGNQPEFKFNILKGLQGQVVSMVAVPSFHKSGTLVLVNLRTLDCQPMTFETLGV